VPVTLVANTVFKIPLNPQSGYFGTRINYLGLVYESFRFVQLEAKIMPTTTDIGMSYDSRVDSTATSATFANMSQSTAFSFIGAKFVTPQGFTLNRATLSGQQPLRWYAARTAVDLSEADQGELTFVSPEAVTFYLRLRWMIEFVHPEPPSDYAVLSAFLRNRVADRVDSAIASNTSVAVAGPGKPSSAAAIGNLEDEAKVDDSEFELLSSVTTTLQLSPTEVASVLAARSRRA